MNDIQQITVGGLPIAVEDCDGAARTMLDFAYANRGNEHRPLYVTSANGQVLSMCASDKETEELFLKADLIHADGTPLVKASRLLSKTPLPERVATTDLVHNTARIAEKEKATFYFLGATQDGIELAVKRMKALYPALEFVGYRNGYIKSEQEDEVIAQINAAKPDILWIGMGGSSGAKIRRSQSGSFDRRWSHQDIRRSVRFLVRPKMPAHPQWMQDAGLEWAFRIYQEPGRLFWRYLATNPHALWLLLTRTR